MKGSILVTGAARGIGLAIADQLVTNGQKVLRLDRDFTAESTNEIPFDLAAIESHASLVEHITSRHGPILGLINNAGIASPKRGDFLELQPDAFDAVMDINLRGTVFFTQAVAKAMLIEKESQQHPSPRRTIQFITSASAVMASPERLDYCMSKAALSMFAKGLALRLAGEGIDVFEIRPGIIRTDMTAVVSAKYDTRIAEGLVPEARWGEPSDIATICTAIASGALPFATGSIIEAGGGLSIPRL
jgi:3-oxoacyl-[acyl-carrier protein] reductase